MLPREMEPSVLRRAGIAEPGVEIENERAVLVVIRKIDGRIVVEMQSHTLVASE